MSTIRFAFRQLAGSPGFSAIAVITLALGIGLNTAMFSVLNTFLLRPLAFAEPDRLFRLYRSTPQEPEGNHRAPNYLEIERQSRQVADVAGYCFWGFTLTEPGRPAVMGSSLRVSPDFLDVLRLQPAMGRAFRPEEEAVGFNRVVILTDAFWRSRYGADPDILGRVVKLDDQAVEIVGVLPPSEGMRALFGTIDFLRPLGLTEEERTFRSETFFQILGRYRPGVAPAAAQAHFDVVAGRLVAERPQENAGLGLRTVPLQSTTINEASVTITYLLLGLSGFVLLIACANLANLLIARTVSRSREFAMRAALGASPTQLVRPLAAECLLIVAAGVAASIPLSIWTTEWLGRQLGGDGPPILFDHDWRVLGFAIAAAFATALFVGLAPAWLISRVNVNDALKSGARGSTADPTHHRFRNALIVGQVALTLVLLAGAAAFARGINQLVTREAGWNAAALLSGRFSVPGEDQEALFRFHRQVRDRLASLPGVESASVDIDLPLYGFLPGQRAYVVEGRERPRPGHEPTAMTNMVSPEYFETVGTPILRGRGILPSDTHDSPRVVVINETMARTLFPRGDAIGHRLGRTDRDPEWAEIVGVARDVRFLSIAGPPTAFQVYKPLSQETWGFVTATVKAADGASPEGLIEPFRRAIAEVDPNIPVLGLMPVPMFIRTNNQSLVTINQLLFGFAGLGLFVAALGQYGVVMRLVTQRTIEIGIRMALGARFGDVVRLVLSTGLRMTLTGLVLGLLGAWGLTRLLNTELPGLATNNALTVAAAAALLVVVSAAACYLPARRAAKVDPLVAIRAE